MAGREKYIQHGSLLDTVLQEAVPLGPKARIKVLYDSAAIERVHHAAATLGDTVAPTDIEQGFHHFIAFVKADDGHLWELNGGKNGPVDRGFLGVDEDTLSERALDLAL